MEITKGRGAKAPGPGHKEGREQSSSRDLQPQPCPGRAAVRMYLSVHTHKAICQQARQHKALQLQHAFALPAQQRIATDRAQCGFRNRCNLRRLRAGLRRLPV